MPAHALVHLEGNHRLIEKDLVEVVEHLYDGVLLA
ncbi:unnamed protein product, partial [marine sediment metagenome]